MAKNDKFQETLKSISDEAVNSSQVKPTESKARGIKSRYLAGDPNCKICIGLGYIGFDVPQGHPKFGQLEPCECREEEIGSVLTQRLYSFSNFQALHHLTFDAFNPKGKFDENNQEGISSLIAAYQGALRFADDLSGWIYFQGKYGCGKTHLAAAIANKAIEKGHEALFLTVPDLLDWLRFSYSDPDTTFETRFEEFKNSPLLILDDFGTENATEWAKEKIFQILNHRYINKLPTVITSNLSLDEIDSRIESRLQDKELVKRFPISAPDFRKGFTDTDYHELSARGRLAKYHFENFTLRENEGLSRDEKSSLTRAKKATKVFASNPGSDWILIEGKSSSGKTHLASSIANHAALNGYKPLYISVPDLLDHLRATFNPKSTTSYDRLFNEVKNAKLLILDDLGTQSATPWAREKLYQLLNYRYNAELPTVITAENLQQIEAEDSKLANKIYRSSKIVVIAVEGYGIKKDIVQKKQNSRNDEETPGYYKSK